MNVNSYIFRKENFKLIDNKFKWLYFIFEILFMF